MASKLSEKIAAESRQKRPPTEILCDICENRDFKVSRRCMDCAMNLCKKCLENHQSLSAFTGHKTTPITKSLFCDIHKGVVVSMFCEDCKVVVCRTCVMKIHGKHTCRDVSIIAQQIRDKLKTAVESTASKQSDSAMLRSLNTMVSKLEYKKEKQIKEIKDLRYYFKDMIARLDRTELEFQSAIDTEIQELVKNEKELIGRSLLARTLMAEKSDIELVLKGQTLEFPEASRYYKVTEPRVEGNLNKMKRTMKEMMANLTVVKVTSTIEADQSDGAITSQFQQLKVNKSKSFQFAVDKSSSAPQNPSPDVSKSTAPATANFHTVERKETMPSSAWGVFKTGVSDSKMTGGRFKTGGASINSSDDTSDDNNKSGFGGFTFRQNQSDSLLAQELEKKDREARKEKEDKEFERFQELYGMKGNKNYKKQAQQNMEKAVYGGQMSIADFFTKRHEVHQSCSTGVDDGHSCTKDILAKIQHYYKSSSSNTLNSHWLASATSHYAASYGDKGWGCGYRNFQMLLSCLGNDPTYEQVLSNGRPVIPSIPKIQRLIETAWQKGFDQQGCEQLGGKVVDTTKWIGATEILATLSSLRIKCQLLDFHAPSGKDNTHPRLFEWDRDYFKKDSVFKPPLYLQHQGNSRTIVGVEDLRDGSLCLLLFDPCCGKKQMSQFISTEISANLMRTVRRPLSSMKAKQYQIVAVRGVIAEKDYEDSKILKSDRIPS